MKIVDELSTDDHVLEKLESDCDNRVDFVKRQVAFCARWSLDNLCMCCMSTYMPSVRICKVLCLTYE